MEKKELTGILPILHYPNELLRKASSDVDRITDDLQQLIEDMIRTLYAAPGVGLAAPQVGVLKKVIVIDTSVGKKPDSLIVMINPEILSSEGEQTDDEGCLSVPDFTGPVTRAERVEVGYLTREGKQVTLHAEGLLARAIQHEGDHLRGVLFIDRLSPVKRDMIKRKIKKAIRQGAYP